MYLAILISNYFFYCSYVFEDQIDFVKVSVMDGIDEEPTEAEAAKTISQGLQVLHWNYLTFCIILFFLFLC